MSRASNGIGRLLEIMARLRHPDDGCPWDREQTFRSIAPYTIEEAYEVDDAIRRENMTALKQELGDLLFQVVFHARMAEESGNFDFHDVVAAINEKMERRHPHVFGDDVVESAAAQTKAWEDHKDKERDGGILSEVPVNMPALTRTVKLSARSARVGFDWQNAVQVREKVSEELAELDEELQRGDTESITHEVGDLLCAVANLARQLDIDPEQALRDCNTRFERRFSYIERELAKQGRTPDDADLEEMEALWQESKSG